MKSGNVAASNANAGVKIGMHGGFLPGAADKSDSAAAFIEIVEVVKDIDGAFFATDDAFQRSQGVGLISWTSPISGCMKCRAGLDPRLFRLQTQVESVPWIFPACRTRFAVAAVRVAINIPAPADGRALRV